MFTDEFQWFDGVTDCNSGDEVGDVLAGKHYNDVGYWYLVVWPPESANQMHICWRTSTDGVTSSWYRVDYTTSALFSITLADVNVTTLAWPKILEFSHESGSTILDTETTFWFSFANTTDGHSDVIPSHNPNNSSDLGLITVVQSIYEDEVLINQTLTHTGEEPNQGYVSCQKSGEQSGKCFISNLNLTAGYDLNIIFYTNSFSYKVGSTRYYLFGDSTAVAIAYTHTLHIVGQILASPDTEGFDKITYNSDNSSSSSYFYYDNIYYDIHSGWTISSVVLDLYVSGQVCESPTATINLNNYYKSSMYITNLDMKN